MTLVPLSHFTFCVDIQSCAEEEGEPFVISEFHCNLFDPIRPEHHQLPSQQQRPPAHYPTILTRTDTNQLRRAFRLSITFEADISQAACEG
jgi:hypothetical protein